jgi:hypothetical protein
VYKVGSVGKVSSIGRGGGEVTLGSGFELRDARIGTTILMKTLIFEMSRVDGKKLEGDQYFMYNMAILVGSTCEVTVRESRDGPKKRYEGVFAAYAAERHEILIEAAHRVNEDADDEAPITEHYDMLVVPIDKVSESTQGQKQHVSGWGFLR